MRSIISYADPLERRDAAGKLTKPAHAGQIHQAHNSIYAGRASAQYLWLTRTGQVLSRRTLNKIASQDRGHAYATRQLLAAGAPPRVPFEEPAAWLERTLPLVASRVRHPGNHVFAFDEAGKPRSPSTESHVERSSLPGFNRRRWRGSAKRAFEGED